MNESSFISFKLSFVNVFCSKDLLFLFLFSHFFCHRDKKPELTSREKRLVQIYVQLLKLREDYPLSHPTYLDSSLSILQKHHFTKGEYDSLLSFLNEKPQRWEAFYQEVLEKMND